MQVQHGLRAFGVAAIASFALVTVQAPAPAAAASPADRVIAVAQSKLGAPWSYAAEGPSRFDCSGLVIYSFERAGYGSKVANGRYRSAAALYYWYKARGLASRTGGKRGDLVVWGGGSHIGIYLGNGRAISTLTTGVAIHGIYAVTASFTAFLHTGMSGAAVATTATSATHRVSTKARATTTYLRLRSGPSTRTRILGLLAPRARLAVSRTYRDPAGRIWYLAWASSLHKSGWVAGAYTRAV